MEKELSSNYSGQEDTGKEKEPLSGWTQVDVGGSGGVGLCSSRDLEGGNLRSPGCRNSLKKRGEEGKRISEKKRETKKEKKKKRKEKKHLPSGKNIRS